jgi:hypothetical protein
VVLKGSGGEVEEEEIYSQVCQLRKSSQLARDVAVEVIIVKESVEPTPSEKSRE